MFNYLQGVDERWFLSINTVFHHPWLDQFFLIFTDLHKNYYAAIVLVFTIMFFTFQKFRHNFWKPILAMIIAASLSDLIAYRIFKATIDRPRPSQNETLLNQGAVIVGVAHGNSFPSNHAANIFALATTLTFTFPSGRKYFYIFAALVALSRVFLGVHYPMDVIAGACLGVFCGWISAVIFRIQFMKSTQEV